MKVAVLTEGNSEIGYGHISRCISISQALAESGHTVRFIINGDERTRGIAKLEGAGIYDWYAEAARLERDVEAMDALFIDAITVPDELLFGLADRKHCAIIDDFKRREYRSGIIIDWTILAEAATTQNPGADLEYLLGARYTALRKAFWDAPVKTVRKEIERILITFGGTDIRGLTPQAIGWLKRLAPRAICTAIVGNGVLNQEDLEGLQNANVRILRNLDEAEMSAVMAESDLALAAGGQTLYELARMGVPTLAVTVIDNQVDDVTGWEQAGFLIHAGWWNDPALSANIEKGFAYFTDAENRARHSRIGSATLDGRGARRIVAKMEERFGRG